MDNSTMIDMQPVCYAAIYVGFFHDRAHVDEFFRYWADELSDDYGGGSRHNPATCNPKWEGRRLSNGGFYLTPMSRLTYQVSVAGNGYEGTMTAEAFGITLSLFALCHIAERTEDDRDIWLYHALRDYAQEHSESVEIMAAID